jgi:hypothetical protein
MKKFPISPRFGLILVSTLWSHQTNGFALLATPSHKSSSRATFYSSPPSLVVVGEDRLGAFVLEAAAGKKKSTRRRVRKQAPGATAEDPVKQAQAEVADNVIPKGNSDVMISSAERGDDDDGDESLLAAEPLMTEKDRMLMEDVAKFEFSPPKANVVTVTPSSSGKFSRILASK